MPQLFLPTANALVDKDGRVTPSMWAWMRDITAAFNSGGGFAPADATYFLKTADTDLPNGLVATNSSTVTLDYSTPTVVKWVALGANLFHATVTLTDAQIKTLPTTPFELVAAQGANTRIVPVQIDLEGLFTAGAYTNVDTVNAALYAGVADASAVQTNYVANDAAIPRTFLTDFFSAVHSLVTLVPFTFAEPVSDWGNLGYVGAVSTSNLNAALNLFVANNGAGNFTGGNAANTLVVHSYYAVVS